MGDSLTLAKGDRFQWMGDNIEDCVEEVLQWFGADESQVAEATRIVDSLERDEYGDLRDWNDRLLNSANDERIHRLGDIVGTWLEGVGLTLAFGSSSYPAYSILPALMHRGESIYPERDEFGIEYEVSDHGNVTASYGGQVLWDCV